MRIKPKAFSVAFAGPLPVGSKMTIKGLEFEVMETRPHERRDGGMSDVMTWMSDCMECGQEFTQTTGRSFSSLKRRCDECRPAYMAKRGLE